MKETPLNDAIWTRLDVLPDKDIAALAAAAVAVLSDSLDSEESITVLNMPMGPLTAALQSSIAARGVTDANIASRIVSDAAIARPIAVQLLTQIAVVPEVAHQVELVYEARKGMLVVDGGLICAAAFLFLALKIKKIKLGNMEIEFTKVSDGALKGILKFLGA